MNTVQYKWKFYAVECVLLCWTLKLERKIKQLKKILFRFPPLIDTTKKQKKNSNNKYCHDSLIEWWAWWLVTESLKLGINHQIKSHLLYYETTVFIRRYFPQLQIHTFSVDVYHWAFISTLLGSNYQLFVFFLSLSLFNPE